MNGDRRPELRWIWAGAMLNLFLVVLVASLFAEEIANAAVYLIRWLPISWLVALLLGEALTELGRRIQAAREIVWKSERNAGVRCSLLIVGWLAKVVPGLLITLVAMALLIQVSSTTDWKYPYYLFLDLRLESWFIGNQLRSLSGYMSFDHVSRGGSVDGAALFRLILIAVTIVGYGCLCANIAGFVQRAIRQFSHSSYRLVGTMRSALRAIQSRRLPEALRCLQRAQTIVDNAQEELANWYAEIAVVWALYYYAGGPQEKPHEMWRKIAYAQRQEPHNLRLGALVAQLQADKRREEPLSNAGG